jgi:MtN3 and saliva related transmembrane protein
VLAVLGAAASFFSLSSTVPQILRAVRHRSSEGVSWSSLLMNLSASVLWAVYAAAAVDQVLLANNLVAVGLLVVLALVLLVADGRSCWYALLLTGAAAVVGFLAAVAVVLDPFALALVAMVITSVRMWPQARLAVARVPLWGLDPWATALGWVGWLLWSAYGVATGDTAVGVCSVTGLVLHSVVCAFRLPPRRTLHSIASGRLGPLVAQVASPVSGRFPFRAEDYSLVA